MISVGDMPEGLHPGVPSAAYHTPVLGMGSKSAMEVLYRSPAHYRAWLAGQSESNESDALRFGAAFHCAILEPAVFRSTYALEPDFGDCRFKSAKADRDAWRAANGGKLLLSAKDAATIAGMAASLREHPLAGAALRDGEAELTALWRDAETGIRYRARADYYVPQLGMVLDVKTTEDASADAFAKSAFRYRYHWQHAIYRAGFAALGEQVRHFVFVAIEKSAPYAVALHELDDSGVRAGHRQVSRLNRTLADCMEHDTWPAYPVQIQTLQTPEWAKEW